MQIGESSLLITKDNFWSILQLIQIKYGDSLEESGNGHNERYKEEGYGEG